ncbi:MAG: hypothetical protein AVDCRST_MAG48-2778 [uncultured Friedmanniella sp.]|uniref:Uncharacterized protein n=1 Tax=uncultured Friedmanniella sp. TaxID=335381 RepID=A0A6J4L444_9ACTN|nr:MAG: hypothetical protein AVDCRST_MAG48-2778 [uncultured Friedmanniella sp.]
MVRPTLTLTWAEPDRTIFDSASGPEIERVSDDGHRAIASAITARDCGAAETAAAAHVAETERLLRRLHPPPSTGGPGAVGRASSG